MEKRIIEFEGKGIHISQLKTKFDTRKIVVRQLPTSDYELKQELPISLKSDSDTLIASYEKLGSFGLGATEQEAVNDLLSELIEIYKDIENNPQYLGKNSRQWWSHMRQIIKKKSND